MDPLAPLPLPSSSPPADGRETARVEPSRTRLTPRTTIGNRFWLLFAASTVNHLAYSASTPILPRFVRDVFHGDPATVGTVVALAPIVSLVVLPVAGAAADRVGYRRLAMLGSVVASTGMLLTLPAISIPVVGIGRILFGSGEAAVMTALMAWIVGVAEPLERGKALSIFGVSVWIGLALGPVVGENVFQAWGFRPVWVVCSVLPLLSLAAVASSPAPALTEQLADANPPTVGGDWRAVLRAVLRPGIVGGLVWAAQGVMLAYLVLHLESQGMRTDGPTGAASVFTVFALSVIVARLVLGSLPDRLGPVRSSQWALVTLAAGMLVLTAARSFPVAALGAVVLGAAFAPLYPALVMLAVADLDPSRRAVGVGGFNSFSSLGMAVGAFAGGLFSGWWGEWSAFVAAAGAQIVALVIVGPRRPDR